MANIRARTSFPYSATAGDNESGERGINDQTRGRFIDDRMRGGWSATRTGFDEVYVDLNLINTQVEAQANVVITSVRIGAAAIITSKLADDAVTTDKIADDAVTADKIASATITGGNIALRTITGDNILSGGIGSNNLARGSVGEIHLAGFSVTNDKLATNAVSTMKILGLSVTGPKLAVGAVTETKIANLAVTAGKLADGAVTEDKIADDAVTADKIATGAILGGMDGNIMSATITERELADMAVTADKIKANAVTMGKIMNGAVTAEKLAAGVLPSTGGTVVVTGDKTGGLFRSNTQWSYNFTDAENTAMAGIPDHALVTLTWFIEARSNAVRPSRIFATSFDLPDRDGDWGWNFADINLGTIRSGVVQLERNDAAWTITAQYISGTFFTTSQFLEIRHR